MYIYKLYINLKLRKLWQIADQLRRYYFITTDLITFFRLNVITPTDCNRPGMQARSLHKGRDESFSWNGAVRRDDFVEVCVPAELSIAVNVWITCLENHENKLSWNEKARCDRRRRGWNSWELYGTSSLSRIDCRDADAARRRDAARCKSCAFKAPQFPGIHLPRTCA